VRHDQGNAVRAECRADRHDWQLRRSIAGPSILGSVMAGLVPAIHAVQLQECFVRVRPQTRQIALDGLPEAHREDSRNKPGYDA
jgi:hypothetical protein